MKNKTPETISSLINKGVILFEKSQIQNAKIDAELIVSHFLNSSRAALYLNRDQIVDADTCELITKAFEKRGKRYPLQYIIQEVSFLNTRLLVDESVLIARPETEFLCEKIIQELMKAELRHNMRCLDIGTGSGAIAISIKKELSEIEMDAVDISTEAIKTASKNALLNQTDIHFIQSDLFENIHEKYDLIVSNPPYVTEEEYAGLEPELFFEPKSALVSENKGLSHIFQIIRLAPNYLKPNGVLYLEIGASQAGAIINYIKEYRFKTVTVIKDLGGFDRFIKLEI